MQLSKNQSLADVMYWSEHLNFSERPPCAALEAGVRGDFGLSSYETRQLAFALWAAD